ncbi:DNA primase, partial [Streptomyces sp. MAR25Y5]|nr:DNA primase [Streptomyces sp. MAR25Y5]
DKDEYKDKDDESKDEYGDKDDEGKDEYKDKDSKHDKPSGGVHTGGGALAALNDDGWSGKHDKEESKDEYKKDEYKDEDKDKDEYGDKKDWEHGKPSGGVHTGGGGLSDPSVSGGGLAALTVLGAGAYALRRKRTSGSVA